MSKRVAGSAKRGKPTQPSQAQHVADLAALIHKANGKAPK